MLISPTVKFAITNVIEEEGGWQFTDRKNDPDLGTYGGMRYISLRNYLKEEYDIDLSLDTFKRMAGEFDLTVGSAETEQLKLWVIECYNVQYAQYIKLDSDIIPTTLKQMFFSCSVNLGEYKAAKLMQRALNVFYKSAVVTEDSRIGPKTLNEFASLALANQLVDDYQHTFVDEWIRHYINIVQANSILFHTGRTKVNQSANLEGWFNRAIKFRPSEVDI